MNWPLLLSTLALVISIAYRRRPLAIVARKEWVVEVPESLTPLERPASYVVISHTATDPCDTKEECIDIIRSIHHFHTKSRKWWDIGYNFLVGGDGLAYEGRGWDAVGAHAKGYNDISMGISFVGTFIDVCPPRKQIRAAKDLIDEGVRIGKISRDYKLLAHRQISPTESPGDTLYEELKKWEHWSETV